MDLDLVHIHGACADGSRHLNALALCASGIGGHEACQFGLVLGDHIEVGTETAGGQNDALGVDDDGVAVLIGTGNAHGCAVGIGQDGIDGGVQHDVNAALLAVLLQQRDHVSAHGDDLALFVDRAVDALDGCTAEAGDVVQGDAVLIQPVDGVCRAFAQGLDQLRVIDALAADHGVQLHQLHAVEVAGGVGLIGCPLLGNGLGQCGDGLIVGILFSSRCQRLFHTGSLIELVLVLIDGLGCIHAAGSAGRVAAHHGLALQDDDLLACIGSGHGSGHACAACTDDDDVGIIADGLAVGGLVCLGHVIVGVQAGLGQSSLGSLHERIGGDGRTTDAVEVDGVAFHDFAGELLNDHRANAGGLLVALGGAVGNDVVRQGQGDGHIAHALSRAGKAAGHAACCAGGGCAAAACGQEHRTCQEQRSQNVLFLHGYFSLILIHFFSQTGTFASHPDMIPDKQSFHNLFEEKKAVCNLFVISL